MAAAGVARYSNPGLGFELVTLSDPAFFVSAWFASVLEEMRSVGSSREWRGQIELSYL